MCVDRYYYLFEEWKYYFLFFLPLHVLKPKLSHNPFLIYNKKISPNNIFSAQLFSIYKISLFSTFVAELFFFSYSFKKQLNIIMKDLNFDFWASQFLQYKRVITPHYKVHKFSKQFSFKVYIFSVSAYIIWLVTGLSYKEKKIRWVREKREDGEKSSWWCVHPKEMREKVLFI